MQDVEQGDQIADQVQWGVLVRVRRARTASVAAHVHGDGVVTGGSHSGHLPLPGAGGVGESVNEKHRLAASLLHHVQGDAVGRHERLPHTRAAGRTSERRSGLIRPCVR